MANNFLNTNWVSMDILRLLLNKLEVAEYFNRSWERDFEKGVRARRLDYR